MAKLKSERHHWWPRGLSAFWASDKGMVHWLRPDGTVVEAPPAKLGMIGNAHHIKLASRVGEESVWDETFEKQFDAADSMFPTVIKWLETLEREARFGRPLRDRYMAQPIPPDMQAALLEGMVSLAVRGPMNREASVSLAEKLRGPIKEPERSSLIGANMRDSQRIIVDSIKDRGKFAVIFSPDREFIFGDGFYHNLLGVRNAPMSPTILAPLTPRITVLFALPMRYTREPVLSSLVVDVEEATQLNEIVQVYSRNALFYRDEAPVLTEHFKAGKHLAYNGLVTPVTAFVHSIPGVPDRDTSIDFLFA